MIARSRIIASGSFHTLGATSFRSTGQGKADLLFETREVSDAAAGVTDEIVKSRQLTATFRPLYYDPTVTNAILFPWLSVAATPPGTEMFGADTAYSIKGTNGDVITAPAAAVLEMSNIFLGVEEEFYTSDTKIVGINSTGLDPDTEANFITIQTGQTNTLPAIPGTSVLGSQKYTAVWGTFAGFTSFQGFKGFHLMHELKTKIITDNGQIIGCLFLSYRCMAKVIASANTMQQMVAALAYAGTGAAQGQRLSAQSADLVISGASGVTATVKLAAMKSGGFVFAGEELRQGEIGFVSTNPSGTLAGLVLA
jgi:hypothetical protein